MSMADPQPVLDDDETAEAAALTAAIAVTILRIWHAAQER